jgi:hypothetical protein
MRVKCISGDERGEEMRTEGKKDSRRERKGKK